MLAVGDKLPEVTLPDDTGRPVSTRDLVAGHLVLWFYPKDNTSG
jgi:thioredoxin-dependent peroxiredoxin